MQDRKRIEDSIANILELIGEDTTREGLKETPKRVSKMYGEVFKGYDEEQKPRMAIFDNNGEDGVSYDQMIIDTGYFFSYCEHHMVPFFGQYYFGYIPDKKVLGISKVSRIIDWYAAKLQVQERLGKEVVDEIEESVEPFGVGLVLRARHLCKEMRGVQKYNSEMVTAEMRGVFRDDREAKSEFLDIINTK